MEIRPPSRRISQRGLKVWRITGGLYSFCLWLLVISSGFVIHYFDWPKGYTIAASCLALIVTILNVMVVPTIRWRRWRYDVNEYELELQYGVFFIHRTLIPMVRVQHVDTSQGPLLKKYDLATVSIFTAATVHKIPAVDVHEAEQLRRSISALARVAEDDV